MAKEKLELDSEKMDSGQQDSAIQHEDAALKTAFRDFSDVLLPYFGITKKVVEVTETELVWLDVKKFYEDFNFVMDDGSWVHFEFQSKNEGLDGLKRFRVYESLVSYEHKADITTYVLFSGKIKKPMSEFKSGINTFRIVPITMRSHNADQLILALQKKQECGEEVTKEELVPLTLCLLMDGEMSLKERVRADIRLRKKPCLLNRRSWRRLRMYYMLWRINS